MQDLIQQRVDAIADRIEALLSQSNDQYSEMKEASSDLLQAGLLNFSVSDRTKPAEFAEALRDNPLIYEAVQDMTVDFHPQLSETVGDLVSHLLLTRGSLD